MNETISVVIADDQAVVRDGLALLLSAADDLAVLAVAADGTEAVTAITGHRPDVALVDLRMPGLDGAAVTARVAAEAPEVRVLILTTYADDDATLPALRAGASGYLTKDATGEALVAAVRTVAQGGTVLDPAVSRRLVELAGAPTTAPPVADPDVAGLTAREIDVLRLIAQGLSNQQAARRLVVGESTVKTHVNHLLSKLGLDGRAALVAWAWRHGVT